MKRYLALIGLIAVGHIASAQMISVGVLGGVAVSDSTGGNNESKPYTVGASVEIRLPAGFALEADGLYRRLGNSLSFTATSSVQSVFYTDRLRGNAWEVPLLGKYYFRRSSAWQPFTGAGFAFRTTDGHDASSGSILPGTGLSTFLLVPGSYTGSLEIGAQAVAGIRLHAGRLALLPQVRYTRWSGGNGLTGNNETSVLLGLTF